MTTYEELLQTKSKYEISYDELISTQEWFDRREEILERDNYTCTTCGHFKTTPHFNPVTGNTDYLIFGKNISLKVANPDGTFTERIVPDMVIRNKPLTLHVHHKRYILERLPWEYGGKDLITMCDECHWKFHEENAVEVFKTINDTLEKINATPCPKCNGAGKIPKYSHVENGTCFTCRGMKYIELFKDDPNL